MKYKRKKIGDILLSAGLISEEQLENALKKQAGTRERIGKVLVDMGLVNEEKLAQGISEQLHIPRIDLKEISVAEDIMALLPRKFMISRHVVPIEVENNRLKLAMADPLDYVTIKDVQFLTGKTVEPFIITSSAAEGYVKNYLGRAGDVKEALKRIKPAENIEVLDVSDESEEDILRLKKAGEAPPIISMVNMILSEAIKADASDIHIEPREKDVLVRYRIDGLLRDMTTLPIYVQLPIVSRIKIMARMDISIRRRPLDGGTKIKMGEKEIDLRISTLPTLYGEKMVIRILDKSRKILSLQDLGISRDDLKVYRSFLQRPQGMVLVTGPTGSGKSTTLYASLLEVRSEGVNIITIEDPIEYQIPGINQVNVNERAGITFATGLRSLLRQDPNIIMVGEIRDRETAEIAFQAALTGHLVLTTLHTSSAVSAITRLFDVGIEPYLVASSVIGVVAQRLVRLNCPHCLEQHNPDPMVISSLHLDPAVGNVQYFHGKGCEKCDFIGYRGRTGIYEIFKIDDSIRDLIINRASEKKILKTARSNGMKIMEEDGLKKAIHKLTTLEEILRVIPPEEITRKEKKTSESGKTASSGQPDSAPARTLTPASGEIILVEGQRNSMLDLSQLLEKEGYSCFFALKSKEVMDLLKEHPSALVISNILLADTDIGELEKMIKAEAKTRHVPMLALPKGAKSSGFIRKFGFDEDRVILRPFDPVEIRAKLDPLIKGSEK